MTRIALASLLVLTLLAWQPLSIDAVDRSKFRTCDKTSFCKRHREGQSSPAFDYILLRDSIRFHGLTAPSQQDQQGEEQQHPEKEQEDPGPQEDLDLNDNPPQDQEDPSAVGYLSKMKRFLSRTLPHSSDSAQSPHDNDSSIDPYLRGPPPFFTATLSNASPDSYYTSSNDAGEWREDEMLDLALYLHEDGVARVRITERYGIDHDDAGGNEKEKAYGRARWTSDELILNFDEMKAVNSDDVMILDWDQIQPLVEHSTIASTSSVSSLDKEDYMAFRFGNLFATSTATTKEDDKDAAAVLLIQFHPFAIHMWRTTASADGMVSTSTAQPIVSFNSDQLFHFEVRRFKQQQEQGNNGGGDAAADHNRHGHDHHEDEHPMNADQDLDRHGGKEIVGYWEDGLAIYADGTREEKRTLDEEIKPEADADAVPTATPTAASTFQIDTRGMWEESFSSHHDSKPYGPTSVGGDIVFPASSHIYGLPEHASSTILKSTTGGDDSHYKEPYRLYNLDVFEYELDETMALYGEVPLIVSQSVESGSVGVFWFNPSETFVDVQYKHNKNKDEEDATAGSTSSSTSSSTHTHWISESGVIDLFLLPGPDPHTLYGQYARLTGRVSLPPMFSLGYHQCRWNYRDEEDVYAVHSKFEQLDYPYDVLWLDIEHTDGKRYFTWDQHAFPHPVEMQKKLDGEGRKMVTIVDPHMKRDGGYYIHKEATEKGLYIKDKTGEKDYDGWCWPGSSSYLDFTSEVVRNWWADQFAYGRYKGSTPSLYTWNDMNEPSVFNGPEVSMQKDLRNLEGVEHREWHNLYGILFQRATAEGLVKRNEGENVRPFVLSRSFFAGSQKYGAIWTGDNESTWAHLQIAAPMLLSLNVGALSFVGADVGGFFGNPDAELMTRWMQAGAYQPFFRGHAHHDSKRREPWVFGDEWMRRMRRAAMDRYALLPYWYNLFKDASVTGMPVMRTMWMEYPNLELLYNIDDQYLVGSDLLVKPVTHPGVTEVEVLFPVDESWYNVDTMQKVPIDNGQGNDVAAITVDSDIDKIPVYQRGGSILPRKLRLRRSTQMMINDPYTLYVALDSSKKALGEIYMDDEDTFDHEKKGLYAKAKLSVEIPSSIRCEVEGDEGWVASQPSSARMIERIVVMGVDTSPNKVLLNSSELEFDHDEENAIMVIRKPNLSALENWKISLL